MEKLPTDVLMLVRILCIWAAISVSRALLPKGESLRFGLDFVVQDLTGRIRDGEVYLGGQPRPRLCP